MSDELKAQLEEIVSSLDAFVYHYSLAEALALNAVGAQALALNDFMHYCIAKGTKHLKASLTLIESGFGEDALVLIRSAYEAYISLSLATSKPDIAVQSYVYDKIALKLDRATYSKTKKGKTDFRRIVRLPTGEVADAPPSVEKALLNANNPLDIAVHRQMYDFLSEHVHIHMAGSGNYRDGFKYVTDGESHVLSATMFGLYIGLLLLNHSIQIEDMDCEERARCEREILEASGQLYDFIQSGNFDSDMQGKLLARIDELFWSIPDNS